MHIYWWQKIESRNTINDNVVYKTTINNLLEYFYECQLLYYCSLYNIFQQKLFALYDIEQNRMFIILWLFFIYQSTIFTSVQAIQLINAALARPAYQIDDNSSCNCTAHKAVDGRVDAVNHGCAQTATSTD